MSPSPPGNDRGRPGKDGPDVERADDDKAEGSAQPVAAAEARPTWADYPYAPFPGFVDPDDWRQHDEELNRRDEARVAVWVNDAECDHVGGHDRHDHPWCSECAVRLERFEDSVAGRSNVVYTYAELHEQRLQVFREHPEITDAQITRIHKDYRDVNNPDVKGWWDDQHDTERLAAAMGVPQETVALVTDLLTDEDNLKLRLDDIGAAARGRARRYLLLHNKPPNEQLNLDADRPDDELYVDRDELADLPKPEPLIDGILDRHTIALLSGRRTSYKSFLALDLMLHLATGRDWLGRTTERVKVLYVVGEGAHALDDRVSAWEQYQGTDVDPDWFHVRNGALSLYRQGPDFQRLLARVADEGYGLVVFDTLRRMSGGMKDSNADVQVGQVIDALEQVKAATSDGCVLAVAHTDQNDNSTRGSSAWEDDADAVWRTARTDGGLLKVTASKVKDGPDDLELLLAPTQIGDSLILAAVNAATVEREDTTENETLVLRAMHDVFAQTGATASEVMTETGLSKSSFYRARAALLRSGKLVSRKSHGGVRLEVPDSEQSQLFPADDTASDLRFSQSPSASQASPTESLPVPSLRGTGTVGIWDDLGIGHLPGRCVLCGRHVEKQGHLAGCEAAA